ncbi:MAG: glycosyltransferase [Bacillota bacterium]
MKVLHLISGGDVGGAKTHVLSLLKGLQERITIRLVCFTPGIFYEEARGAGIDVLLLAQNRRYDLSVLRDIYDMAQREGFQLLHTHGARANFLVILLKPWLKRPLVTTVHSDYTLDFAGNLYKSLVYGNLNRLALRFFDYYVAVSRSFRDMLVARGFPADRVFTVYNGIDFRELPPLPPREEVLRRLGLDIPPSDAVVGIVGRLAPVKGHSIFLRAASMVLREYPAVHFLIVGDGEERSNLEAQARELAIADRVHFLGYHPHPDAIMSVFDVNTLASFSESFPYALLEGARLARATVSSDVGSVAELVIHGETGLLYPPGDAGTLARCLLELLAHPERRRELGHRLYEHARANYSLEKMRDQQIAIYERILERRTAVGGKG